MSKVLLINPDFIKTADSIWSGVKSSYPSIGLAVLAAVAERDGLETGIIDMPAEGLGIADVLERVQQFSPDLVGITATTETALNAAQIIAAVKKALPGVQTVAGGVHASIEPEYFFREGGVDFVVRGEGEETFAELIGGGRPEGILGLSHRAEAGIVHNGERPLIPDLDTVPLPAYHLLPMHLYFPALGSFKRLPAISILTSRGCPGNCTFCYKDMFGNKTRYRSAGNVLAEIRLLWERYGIREISFYDDTFTAKKENVRELCRALLDEGIDLSWSCFARVDFVDEETLALMKRAGCHQVMFGIETDDPEVLKNIGKRVSGDKAREAVRMAKRAGINVRGAFMLGNPGDTPASLQRTIDYAIELDPDFAIFNVTTPYPGTRMYEWAKENGYLKSEDWAEYDLSHAVMELPSVSAAAVDEAYSAAYRRFYMRPTYMLKRALKINTRDEFMAHLKAAWEVVRTGFSGIFGKKTA